MIKGILFDMDGVLVDNMHIHIEAFERFCAQFGVSNVKKRMYECAGMGNDQIMHIMLPAEVIKERGIDSLSEEKEALYREIYAATIEPIPHLIETLEELRTRGIKCAVGSSGCKANVDFVLSSLNITEYFDGLVYSDLVTKCKPDPEIYLTAAKQLALEPSECLVVEDAIVGIKSARNAEVGKVVALTTTISAEEIAAKTDADIIINDYSGFPFDLLS